MSIGSLSVNTNDSLLITNKDNSENIKYIDNNLVYRPWGYYINIDGSNSNYKVKKICVYPNKKLSLQSHKFRSEHWVIINGSAKIQIGKDFLFLNRNQNIFIPKETLHRVENIGSDLLEIIETQIGDYLGEDDIIRYDDDFGRI